MGCSYVQSRGPWSFHGLDARDIEVADHDNVEEEAMVGTCSFLLSN